MTLCQTSKLSVFHPSLLVCVERLAHCTISFNLATRILASIPTMVEIIEKSIESYFATTAKPDDMATPSESTGFGWYNVIDAMVVPDTILAEFHRTCVDKCACLALHALLLQTLPMCKNYAEEKKILGTIIDWCMQIKLK